MRIGLVIDYFKPHSVGGAERSTRELALALVKRGHEVAILTPNYGAPPEEDDQGARICRYWFPRRVEPGRMASAFWIKNPLYYAIAGRAIARTARRFEIEVLHAQNTFVQVPSYLAARRLRVPCIATLRDLNSLCSVGYLCGVGYDRDHQCAGSFRRCAREFVARYYPHAGLAFRLPLWADLLLKHADLLWRQRLLRRYSRIVFVSHGLKEEYLRHGFSVRPDRLDVVYNIPPDVSASADVGLPPEWDLPPAAPVVSFVGKLSLGKGAHVLFEAIPRVIERHPEAVFVFAGRPTVQVEAPPAIPARNIRLLGRIPTEQVHALLRRSSLLVFPSVSPDALSSAVLEALAFGVPVVGTNRGGTPEQIVEGKNGLLVEPGDPVALAEGVVALLNDPEALKRMSEHCRTLLQERFDPGKVVEQMLAIYRSAVAEKPRGRRQ
ncbi:hypothetical protein AMJ85_05455 [candidate division BRC1 bacterium SM23_51]|nr:MAG: hypothetical protein AMJ85_05455 [candidate division BRC1 bacterium SM23_51]